MIDAQQNKRYSAKRDEYLLFYLLFHIFDLVIDRVKLPRPFSLQSDATIVRNAYFSILEKAVRTA